MSKKEDELPTEDGDSDRCDGVEEEPGISKSLYEATKLRTIKEEPRTATDWQREYEIMASKRTLEVVNLRLSETENRWPKTTNKCGG